MQNQYVNLVLSTDAKPWLKWTSELHQRFVEAVLQLGGGDKATPKSLTRMMGIPGLTLYHLKSHLQKFRLGRSQPPETSSDHREDYKLVHGRDDYVSQDSKIKELKISQALELQSEIQGKLHEQIEVQRHLQLRIEAQGKYLQSVLKKAQEALATHTSSSSSSSSSGLELAKEKLSKLVPTVKNGRPSSSLSELTEVEGVRGAMQSIESSLTSSESSPSVELSLLGIYRPELQCYGQKKRRRSSSPEENGEDKVGRKRWPRTMEEEKLIQMIDLNTQSMRLGTSELYYDSHTTFNITTSVEDPASQNYPDRHKGWAYEKLA